MLENYKKLPTEDELHELGKSLSSGKILNFT